MGPEQGLKSCLWKMPELWGHHTPAENLSETYPFFLLNALCRIIQSWQQDGLDYSIRFSPSLTSIGDLDSESNFSVIKN